MFLGMVMICSVAAGEVSSKGDLKIIQPVSKVEGVGMTVVLQVSGMVRAIAADKIEMDGDGVLACGWWVMADSNGAEIRAVNKNTTLRLHHDGRFNAVGPMAIQVSGDGSAKYGGSELRLAWVKKQLEGD